MLTPCSPTCITQPITTSSTTPGSMPVRSTSAFSVSAARSTGCQSLSLPLRLPSGVRTASTITAVVIGASLLPAPAAQRTHLMRDRRTRESRRAADAAVWSSEPGEDAAQVGDVVVGERGGDVGLHGAAVGDVHLPPQRAAAPGELDDDGALVVDVGRPLAGDPPLLLQPVEAAAEAGADEAQLVGEVARTGRAAEPLQGGEHVEPAERDVPLGGQRPRRSSARARRRPTAARATPRPGWRRGGASADAVRPSPSAPRRTR